MASLRALKNPSKARDIVKRLYQIFLMRYRHPKSLVFVLGCQRSGTTMLMQTFRRDFQTRLYGETGLSLGRWENKRKLKPYDEIEQIIARENPAFILTKPLVESQNALKLLDHFPHSKVIWMYRHFKAVVRSSSKKFGPESMMYNLRPIVQNGDHWASENISDHVREIVTQYFSEDMQPYDAEALFWYARNRLFFEQNLDQHPRIFLCKYEDIVAEPAKMMPQIYNFVGYPYPGDRIIQHIHTGSINRGAEIELNPEIEVLCDGLLQKFDETYLVRTGDKAKDTLA